MLNKILLDQIENNRLFHSYIFEGDNDLIFEQINLFISKIFNQKIDIKNIAEIIESEKDNISIDKVRKFNKVVFEKPTKFNYNIFIIKDAQYMRVEAQNAILKTIEDMPSYSILIMTTNNKFKLLDTIISRSQTISFKKGEDINFDDEITDKVVYLLQKVTEENYYIISKEKNLIKELAENSKEVLNIITKIFVSLLKLNNGNNIKYNNLIKKLSILNIKSIEKILIKIEMIKEYTKVNINFQLAMENLIFEIIEELKKSNRINI